MLSMQLSRNESFIMGIRMSKKRKDSEPNYLSKKKDKNGNYLLDDDFDRTCGER